MSMELPRKYLRKDKLLTRGDVATILGISRTEVKRRESLGGNFKPVRRDEKHGWSLFHPDMIQAEKEDRERRAKEGITLKEEQQALRNPTNYTPAQAGKVFEALKAGKTLIDCVVECEIHPEIIERIGIAYTKLTGGLFITSSVMEVINGLPLEGEFPIRTEKQLLDIMRQASADTCKGCGARAKVYCSPCAIRKVREADAAGT